MNQAAAEALVSRLEAGWKAGPAGPASEFMHFLGAAIGGRVEIGAEADDHLEFRLSLPKVRLLGADDIRGVILGGKSRDTEAAARAFVDAARVPGRIYLVLAASATAFDIATLRCPPRAAVILRHNQLVKLLCGLPPEIQLKSEFRRQLGRNRLLPFDIEHPAASNMFFGRQSELEMLGGTSSIAIAGPGRIGKSSLLQQHRRNLVVARDRRMHHTIFMDFFGLQDKSEQSVVKFVAMKLNPIRKNTLLGKDDMIRFLRSESVRLGAAPELLMDEVDEVVTLPIFELLAMAAREGLCRLLIAGKSVLFDTMYRRTNALASRLELVRPKPLTGKEGVDLLMQPFVDLGYGTNDTHRIEEAVAEIAGGLPQNIQYLGIRLFKILETGRFPEVNAEVIDQMKSDFEYVHYARSPYRALDKLLKPVAIELLKQGARPFDAAAIQEACQRTGQPKPDVFEAAEIGDLLVIMNVLSWWGRGAYRLSCPALPEMLSALT